MEAGTKSQVNHGKGVRFLRRNKEQTQDELAKLLGISQQTVSNLENAEVIEEGMIRQIAQVFGVPENLIRNYKEQDTTSIIFENTTFGDNATINNSNSDCDKENTYHPIDQLAKIFQEKEILYERLIKLEEQKNEALQTELVKYNTQMLTLAQAIEDLKKGNK